ncbi:hypothetical protein AWM70_01445 [Paenibacillus yonginensis]|uniref:SLH domain-containing protein n=1 Tax=Paenibacillus yonginensis TaxID=1462996 RepID=A0A1B1MW59_9BACL|nr:DUF3889 domain-containing protein [Paenibacillus yonginensis]ANS73408.1 hypothetical protein AWM70_01445 [Paenibacillus yonginensis]
MMSLPVMIWHSVLTLFVHLFTPAAIAASTLHFDDPAYAKWGQLAVKQAQTKYEASVIDYLHIGRYSVSPTVSEERFKLWLKKKGRIWCLRICPV